MKGWKKYPFLLMIIVSSLCYENYKAIQYNETEYIQQETELVNNLTKKEISNKNVEAVPETIGASEDKKETVPDEKAEAALQEMNQQTAENTSPILADTQERNQENQPETENLNGQPVAEQDQIPETRSFSRVEMDYLENALFIGDSRTSTLYEYAGWDSTDFFVKNGMSVWEVWDTAVEIRGEKDCTLEGMLSRKQYGKVYIMLGINELGTGTADTYGEQFQSVVNRIRELQPQAIVFVEAIIHVTQGKDDENTYINNSEINARNEKLSQIADNINVFYIDVNEALDDPATGKLCADYTFDGVHIQAKYIDIWREFLLNHGIV